jgi:hypothetical protein
MVVTGASFAIFEAKRANDAALGRDLDQVPRDKTLSINAVVTSLISRYLVKTQIFNTSMTYDAELSTPDILSNSEQENIMI